MLWGLVLRDIEMRGRARVAKCQIGLVGAGGVAARHARMLATFAEVRLVSVTDLNPERAAAFAGRHGMRAVPGVEELIATGLDAVYVCVPPFAHGAAEEAVAAAGVALFVEKPIGLECTDAERIDGLLRKSGAVSAVGHHWRYSAGVSRARLALREHRPRLVMGAWLDQVPPVSWWSSRTLSGGQVIEQAVHVLDLARLLVGEVVEVCAVADASPPNVPGGDVDGATVMTLRFAGGAVGSLAATCLLGWKHRAGLEVYADGLALALTEDELRIRDSAGPRALRFDPNAAKRAVDRAFVDAVLGRGDDVRSPYSDALRTLRLACAVTRSMTERGPVLVAEDVDAQR
ncbi:MAG: myo-inositol 2-dehydrogenase / D-chiro-inositol 1-dehydrogenase [Pseudonocardiales bacterium]|nr:myo-inositol 2-dehydrogenase / D-chiro-inositol 1-dehydrogenase [Pseudonocardiales bacterium]MDT7753968.1 myo-inositol 2-dehydrogenase / D-chiro-inositol 1-dehydrogenase [Pseudonocardiales bacterium]